MVRTTPHLGVMPRSLTSLFSVRLPALIAVLLAMCAAVPTAADQNDPRLDSLFEALQKTSSEAEIQLLTSQIWDRWTAFENDSGTYRMMVTGMQLMNSGQLAQAEGVFTQIIAAQPDFGAPLDQAVASSKQRVAHGALGVMFMHSCSCMSVFCVCVLLIFFIVFSSTSCLPGIVRFS